MKDRIPNPQYAGRVLITPQDGSEFYAVLTAADDPLVEGTPLNKATLLTDEVAAALELESDDPTPNDAFSVMARTKTFSAWCLVDWTADTTNGGYYQTVTVNGIKSTDNPVADVLLGDVVADNELYKEAWGLIDRITTEDNAVTFWANTDAPTSPFIAQLKVVR